MAHFETAIVAVDDVLDHPNADRLNLIRIGGYTSIYAKSADGSNQIRKGDHVAYIQAGSVLPEWLLRHMNAWNDDKGQGKFSGSKGNRVKPMALRGIFSEGIILPLSFGRIPTENGFAPAQQGDDVSEILGVTKYEPVIPTQMEGQVFWLGRTPIEFDLEPIEKNLDRMPAGAMISATEKLHGTFTGVSILKGLDHPDAFLTPWGSRDLVVWSKGLGAKGLMFKHAQDGDDVLYVRMAREILGDGVAIEGAAFNAAAFAVVSALLERHAGESDGAPEVHLLGETFGRGVQDLHYGLSNPAFRLFDIATGTEHRQRFLDPAAMRSCAAAMGVATAPALYEGPYDPDALPALRDGKTTLDGKGVREGAVFKLIAFEDMAPKARLALKAVSPDYHLRKGGTEYA